MKIAVYTALFGNKDTLRAPIGYKKNDCLDYILFTDDKEMTNEIYQIHLRKAIFDDVAKNARYYKILGDDVLRNYDYLIWHDANIRLIHNQVQKLLDLGKKSFLTTFTHPNRDCFYSEAMTCIRVNKDFSLRILRQALLYFFNGMPAHAGMYSTGILIKNQKIDSGKFYSIWWKQTHNYSRRDQLSIAYTIFKTQQEINVIEDDIFNNIFSVYYLHEYQHYLEGKQLMRYNYSFLKKISFWSVKFLRKLKKLIP